MTSSRKLPVPEKNSGAAAGFKYEVNHMAISESCQRSRESPMGGPVPHGLQK